MALNLIKRVFPAGPAWLQSPKKQITKWLTGIHDALVPVLITYADEAYLDQFAPTTRKVSTWEDATGILPKTGNRTTLEARFRQGGGQSPAFIQSALRDAGFDVYVHEWWDPTTGDTRDPRSYLAKTTGTIYEWAFGDEDAQMGQHDTAYADTLPEVLFSNGANVATAEPVNVTGTATYNGTLTTAILNFNAKAPGVVYNNSTDPLGFALDVEYGTPNLSVGMSKTDYKVYIDILSNGNIFVRQYQYNGGTPIINNVTLRQPGAFEGTLSVHGTIADDKIYVYMNVDANEDTTDTMLEVLAAHPLDSAGFSGSSLDLVTDNGATFDRFASWDRVLNATEIQTWYDAAYAPGVGTQFGEESQSQGYPLVNRPDTRLYSLPDDVDTFPYFWYVGGQTFPNLAHVDPDRRDEFERLLLTLGPTHLWIGVLVNYTTAPENFVLLENGFNLLLESGGRLALE